MLINSATLAAAQRGFSTRFQAAFSAAQTFHEPLVTEVPSFAKEEVHGFMDRIPKMREWLGDRQLNNLVARDVTVRNKPYEDTIEVDRDDIEDDRLGVYNPRIEMLGMQARKLWDQLLVEVLQAGTAAEAYDGQYFFDTDHPVSLEDAALGTQSNNLSLALSATNYATARAAMMGFLGADGQPLGVMPNLLVVPPQLEGTARSILNADAINNGETNVWKGSANLLVIPELANDATAWYLLATGMPIRPFLKQLRKAPEFTSLTDPNSETVFRKKKFLYGVDARGAVAYGPWFLALRSKP